MSLHKQLVWWLVAWGVVWLLAWRAAGAPAALTASGNGLDVIAHLGGSVTQAALADTVAYLASGYELAVVSLAEPAAPVRVGHLVWQTPIVSLAADSATVYVLADALYGVDATLPHSPTIRTTYTPPDTPVSVMVDGADIYLVTQATAGATSQLHLLRAEDEALVWQATLDLTGLVQAAAVQWPYVYLANATQGVQIVQVDTPAAPFLLSQLAVPATPTRLAVQGEHVYVAQRTCAAGCAGLVSVVDVGVEAAPTLLATVTTPGAALDVALQSDHAFVVDADAGLVALDITNPLAPTWVTAYAVTSDPHSLVYAAGVVYLAAGADGLHLIDVSTPAAPSALGHYATLHTLFDVQVRAGYAYVAEKEDGLRILDVHDPAHPVEVAGVDTPGFARALVLGDDYAYVADGVGGLRLIAIETPDAPYEVSNLSLGGYSYDVALYEDFVYVADSQGSLHVISVAAPEQPLLLASLPMPGGAWSVTAADGYLYVGDGGIQVHILDLSDPAQPLEVSQYETTWSVRDVQVVGATLYVADEFGGLHLVDVVDPTQPRRLSATPLLGRVYHLDVVGDFVYAATWAFGLRIYDASSPTAVVEWARYEGIAFAFAVAAEGGYVYVADGAGGLLILRERYAISGQVQGANGLPIADAMITSSGGMTQLTDAAGAYGFEEVRVGSYVLTPTLAGVRFEPPQHTVTLPGPSAGFDFTALGAPVVAQVTPNLTTTLSVTDTQGLTTTLLIAPGTVTTSVTLTVTPVLAEPVTGYQDVFHAFTLSLSPTPAVTWQRPITLSISYSDTDVAGVMEEALLVLRQEESGWGEAGESCQPAGGYERRPERNHIQLQVCAAGWYQLMATYGVQYLPLIRQP